jgi:hypothetical protein
MVFPQGLAARGSACAARLSGGWVGVQNTAAHIYRDFLTWNTLSAAGKECVDVGVFDCLSQEGSESLAVTKVLAVPSVSSVRE